MDLKLFLKQKNNSYYLVFCYISVNKMMGKNFILVTSLEKIILLDINKLNIIF